MTRKHYLGIALIIATLTIVVELAAYIYFKDDAYIIAMLMQFFPVLGLGVFVVISED